MNYRHAYHAGNFADVFKHIVLVAITQSFLKKPTAFCYIDTHAGIGRYDLFSKEALKAKEYEDGIAKILAARNPPALIQSYLECIETKPKLFEYPGSPLIVKHFLRPIDRMVLSELHPEDHISLRQLFYADKQVAVHCQDGYLNLKAFLPPKEKRGFVLIDPPYEKNNELTELLKIIPETVARWDKGVYALWYPIKNRNAIERFYQSLRGKISQPYLITELCIYPDSSEQQLNGCGMLIVNPPWQLDKQLKEVLPWIWETLSINKQGHYKLITN